MGEVVKSCTIELLATLVQFSYDGSGRSDIFRPYAATDFVDPANLPLGCATVHIMAARCDGKEARTSVGGTITEFNVFHFGQVVGYALNGLAGQPHSPGDLRYRPGFTGKHQGADDLPSGAGQVETLHKPITRSQQITIEAEDINDQLGCRRSGIGMCFCCHGKMMHIRQHIVNKFCKTLNRACSEILWFLVRTRKVQLLDVIMPPGDTRPGVLC